MHPDTPSSRPTLPRGVSVAVVVGAVWRCSILVLDKWNQPLLLNDSLYYSAQARQLAEGVFFREIFVDRPGAEHGPLTAVLLATVSWMADPVPWQRAVTVIFGIVTIVLLAVLAGRIAGPRAAVVAAWIAAIYPNLWMNDGLVMSESVSVLLVTAFLLALLAALESTSMHRAVAVGAISGLVALARSELLILSLGAAVALLVADRSASAGSPARMLRRPAALLGVTLLTLAPWVGFNLARFERPVTLSTNDGTTLLGTYCDRTFAGPEIGGWSVFCVVDDPAYSLEEEPSVRSARQRSLALDYARAHVRRLPTVVAARLGRTFDVYGLTSLVAQDVGEERYRWASRTGIVTWWALAITALFGVRRLGARVRWILAIPVVAVLVTTVVFYGGHRIRSSMEPSVVVVAAVALAAWRRPLPEHE